MSIPTKTKIIRMQSIDPTSSDDSGAYETVDESELHVGRPTLQAARKPKGRLKAKPSRSSLGTPATLIFPKNAVPANVREIALSHLKALKQPDDTDSSVMAVATGTVPIVQRIDSAPQRRGGFPSWAPVAAAALVFLGVSTAALAKSSLFRAERAAAVSTEVVAVPSVDLPAAAPPPVADPLPAQPEPVSIMVPAPVPAPEPRAEVVDAPKAAPVRSHHRNAAPEERRAAPVAAPVAARPARSTPALAPAPAAAPPPPRNSEADELARMQAAAKQQLGETLP